MESDDNDDINYEQTESEESEENEEEFHQNLVDRKVKQILKILQPLKNSTNDLNIILKTVFNHLELDDSNLICKKMITNLKSVLKICSLKEHQSGLFRVIISDISGPI